MENAQTSSVGGKSDAKSLKGLPRDFNVRLKVRFRGNRSTAKLSLPVVDSGYRDEQIGPQCLPNPKKNQKKNPKNIAARRGFARTIATVRESRPRDISIRDFPIVFVVDVSYQRATRRFFHRIESHLFTETKHGLISSKGSRQFFFHRENRTNPRRDSSRSR